MVLNEAPSETIQHTWYSRLAQERREFSASVEEALFDSPLEESFWLDDQSQHAVVIGTEKNNRIFPPRLSLQSRSPSGTSARMGTGLIDTHGGKLGDAQPSLWVRFTHRLTSLFTAFRFRPAMVDTPARSAVNHSHIAAPECVPQKRVETGRGQATFPTAPVRKRVSATDSRKGAVGIVSCADPAPTRFSLSEQAWEEGIVHLGESSDQSDNCVLSATTKKVGNRSEFWVSTGTNVRQGSLQSTPSPQRLAGRITRIRLEVVPASSPAISARHTQHDVARASVAVPDMPAFANKSATSLRLPAIEKLPRRPVEDYAFADDCGGTTSLRLPALEKVARRREESTPAWRTGTGMFECGQRDVTISSPSVTASSVVLVMLTANPGPVVVQYVSLQPRKGFTVHLTAPTTTGVPFNYVVL